MVSTETTKTIKCARCGSEIVFKGGKHKYCYECLPIIKKERQRLRDWKRTVLKRQKEAEKRLCKCPACGVEFSRLSQGSKKKYCGNEACEAERLRRKYGYKHRYKSNITTIHTLEYKTKPRYVDYFKRHKRRFNDQPFLSESEFDSITGKACYYCGNEGPNGIDRLDNTRGYVLDNCVPCCKHCNYVKSNLSVGVFKEWVTRFVNYQTDNKTAML